MSWLNVAVAVLPALVTQVGEGVREALKATREIDKPCEHGRPGGRLCAPCAEKKR